MRQKINTQAKKSNQLTTVDSILIADSVKEFIENIFSQQAEITDACCVFNTRGNRFCMCATKGSEHSEIITMLERAKMEVIRDLDDDDEEDDNG